MQGEQVKLDAVCFSKAGRMPAIRHGRQDASGTISGTGNGEAGCGGKIFNHFCPMRIQTSWKHVLLYMGKPLTTCLFGPHCLQTRSRLKRTDGFRIFAPVLLF